MLNDKKDLLSVNFVKLANSILEEINYARVYPMKYYNKLAEWSRCIKDDDKKENYVLDIPNKTNMKIVDVSNYISAMKFVRGRVPSSPLNTLDCLVNSTADYLAILQMNHDGKTKQGNKYLQTKDEFVKRLIRFGNPQGIIGQSIDIGTLDPELLVLKLILDEESGESKPNRSLIFNSKIKLIGISCGILPSSQEPITIIDMCENFFFKNSSLFTIPKQKGYSPTTSTASVISNSDKKYMMDEPYLKSTLKMKKEKENELFITKQYSVDKISNGGLFQPITPKTTTNSIKSDMQSSKNFLTTSSGFDMNLGKNNFNKTFNSFHPPNRFNSDKVLSKDPDNLLLNANIESYNVKKKVFKDKNNNEKILVTKTIRYKDGSIDEMTYKMDN